MDGLRIALLICWKYRQILRAIARMYDYCGVQASEKQLKWENCLAEEMQWLTIDWG